jgi:hypothetical protein
LRSTAWPQGLGGADDYAGVLHPCADPLNPTKQEGLAFTQLMRETVGCMPSRRYLYSAGVDIVLDQIDAAIRGLEQPPQYVNTVEEAGGWPDIEEMTLDPREPMSSGGTHRCRWAPIAMIFCGGPSPMAARSAYSKIRRVGDRTKLS